MKSQISRLSPHQNGKVLGVLLAVSALFVGVPFFTFIFFIGPGVDEQGRDMKFLLFMPYIFSIVYLIVGYFTVVIGSVVYNILYKYIGGFEFEQKDKDA